MGNACCDDCSPGDVNTPGLASTVSSISLSTSMATFRSHESSFNQHIFQPPPSQAMEVGTNEIELPKITEIGGSTVAPVKQLIKGEGSRSIKKVEVPIKH